MRKVGPGPVDEQKQFGPLGIEDDSEDGWEWHYYHKPRNNLTEKQTELAFAISSAAKKLREFEKTETSISIMHELKMTFSAVLVQAFSEDVGPHLKEVKKVEADIFRRVATPVLKKMMIGPLLWTGGSIAALAVLYAVLYLGLIDLPTGFSLPQSMDTFIFVMIGCLVGRILYFSMSFFERIADMSDFVKRSGDADHPIMMLIFDLVVGFVACLLFVTGIVIIAFGGEQSNSGGAVDAAVSSLMIREFPLLALAFGLIVGVVKTEFLKKLKDVASSGLS